jgi:hypothetical protein
MPLRFMDTVHRTLGMGPLPSQPIVEYLARSTSAFYALLGALLWAFSFDLDRYRPLVHKIGFGLIALGVLLLLNDIQSELPRFWQVAEGPIDALFGVILVWGGRTRSAQRAS